MKIKNVILYTVIIALTAFALLTLFLSASIIFDLFDIRNQEGQYVLFIVWANFVSSILYLIASFGLLKHKLWALEPMRYSLILLFVAYLGLFIHIQNGGSYEVKTVYAMGFRLLVTLLFFMFIKFKITTWKKQSS